MTMHIDPDIVADINDPDAEANIENAVNTYQSINLPNTMPLILMTFL